MFMLTKKEISRENVSRRNFGKGMAALLGYAYLNYKLGPGIKAAELGGKSLDELVFDPEMEDQSLLANMPYNPNGVSGWTHTYTVTMDNPETKPKVEVLGASSNLESQTTVIPTEDPLTYKVNVLFNTGEETSTEYLTIDFQAVPVGVEENNQVIVPNSGLKLNQNAPNPFRTSTEITYSLAEKSNVTVDIYDLTGKHVKQLYSGEQAPSSEHKLYWDGSNSNGSNVSKATYLLRVSTPDSQQVKKVSKQ